MRGKVSCLLFPILFQVITVTCQNETTPTSSSEDLITTSHPMSMMAMASSTDAPPLVEEKATTTLKPPATTQSSKEKTTTSPEANTSARKTVAMTTSPPKPTVTTEHGEHGHTSEPTHHGDKNTTNTTHGGHEVHPGPKSTMGYPHEPPVLNTYTEEKEDDGWQISVVVVCSLIIGMMSFVVVYVIKINREYRRKNLRKRKRAVHDQKAIALKMIKTEEPKANPVMEKIKEEKEQKRFSMHSRGDPEESIPLLKLHIMDDGHPVLGGPSDTEPEDTKPSEPSTSEKDSKPLLEENANIIEAALV